MSLKDLTHEKHRSTERTEFSKLLLSGSITKEKYAEYLYQLVLVYNGLESVAKSLGLLEGLSDIERTNNIYQDVIELVGTNHSLSWNQGTIDYYKYLLNLVNDADAKNKVMAHVYVRHMGDLYGGQILSKRVPGQGRFYKFKDVESLKNAIRSKLDDSMGDEANIAFDYAIKIMEELTHAE